MFAIATFLKLDMCGRLCAETSLDSKFGSTETGRIELRGVLSPEHGSRRREYCKSAARVLVGIDY